MSKILKSKEKFIGNSCVYCDYTIKAVAKQWIPTSKLPSNMKGFINSARKENLRKQSPLVLQFLKKMYRSSISLIKEVPIVINGKIYFLDFVDAENGVVVEIDGRQHEGNREYDRQTSSDNSLVIHYTR